MAQEFEIVVLKMATSDTKITGSSLDLLLKAGKLVSELVSMYKCFLYSLNSLPVS